MAHKLGYVISVAYKRLGELSTVWIDTMILDDEEAGVPKVFESREAAREWADENLAARFGLNEKYPGLDVVGYSTQAFYEVRLDDNSETI